jgi:hypothetical protein
MTDNIQNKLLELEAKLPYAGAGFPPGIQSEICIGRDVKRYRNVVALCGTSHDSAQSPRMIARRHQDY